MKIINKKAYFDYFVIDEYISGMMLVGSEVKSICKGDVSLNEGYVIFKDGELFIKNMRVAQYKNASYLTHDEMRERKLLLNKKEISKISKSLQENGTTIIPLEIFSMNNKFKLKIGICKGKKNYDKREKIKSKDIERELQRKF